MNLLRDFDSYPLPQTFSQRLYQEYTCYTVFFVSIEICQISDVLIRKTRRLSVFQQGFFRSEEKPLKVFVFSHYIIAVQGSLIQCDSQHREYNKVR